MQLRSVISIQPGHCIVDYGRLTIVIGVVLFRWCHSSRCALSGGLSLAHVVVYQAEHAECRVKRLTLWKLEVEGCGWVVLPWTSSNPFNTQERRT